MNSDYNTNTRTIAQSTGSYYLSISALTPIKAETGQIQNDAGLNRPSEGEMLSGSAVYIYLPIFLFLLLFIASYAMHTYWRIKNFRHIATNLAVILLAAAVPIILKSINTDISTQTNASPMEVPKNVEIEQISSAGLSLRWQTEKETTGAVRYKLSNKTGSIIISDDGRAVSTHQTVINNLETGQEYNLEILANQIWYGDNNEPIRIILK